MKYIAGILLVAVLQGCMMAGHGGMMHDHMGQSGHGDEHAEKSDSKDSSEHQH